MSRAGQLCIDSAERNGVESHSRYNPGNIMHCANMRDYWPQMDRMFNHARGAGFWSWKPLIIKTDMELMKDRDTLVYADAGIEFIRPVIEITSRMNWYMPQSDIFLFGNNWEHAHWCKADILEEIIPFSTGNPDLPWRNEKLTFGKQVQASVIFIRVSDYTRKFVAEWLDWCLFEGGRLIDDSPSRIRNHPEFRENRHDQAILTTLAYREHIPLHYWPAQYNNGAFSYEKVPEYERDTYPIMFHHHRKRDNEWN